MNQMSLQQCAKGERRQVYMFVLCVLLILFLVMAVLLGDVDGRARQVSQQVLDQTCGRPGVAGRLRHTYIVVWWCGF